VLVDGDEVDALWPAARLIVELDSWEFHAHREAFETDRSRDADHLLADYRTIRITHRRLSEQTERLAAQIRALLS
jgi:very-short-patch-repair endonuclease